MLCFSKCQQYLEDVEQQILISALLQQLEDLSSDKHNKLQERIGEAVSLSNLINSCVYVCQHMLQPKSRELHRLLNE
jgi:TnpA family transposase